MYKQIILVRTDSKMGKGKIAAQAAHASVSVLDKAKKSAVDAWKKEGQKKIVLKASTLDELMLIKKECDKAKIPTALISDAGLTQLESGTITALAIGPDSEAKIDRITGHLKIL